MHNTSLLDFDVVTLARLFGLFVPLVVALITKRFASDGVKGVANVVLSSVAGAVALVLGANPGDHLSVGDFFNSMINSFIVSITSYYALWRATGVTGTLAVKTQDFGIGGTPPTLQTPDKGGEQPYDAHDGGYALLGAIGAVLLVVAVVLAVTTLLAVYVVAYGPLVVLGLIGLILVLVDRSGRRVV